MGGLIDRGQVANFSWELQLSQLKYELKSNIIPIGMLRAGIHYHRALLFKALADRIALHCSLVRGEYNRAWNEVLLTADSDEVKPVSMVTNGTFHAVCILTSYSLTLVFFQGSAIKFPPKKYIVDLIHQPGRLMPHDSPDANTYQKL